jgi:ABC-type Mn2+/Zn2+ transport system permease subunit
LPLCNNFWVSAHTVAHTAALYAAVFAVLGLMFGLQYGWQAGVAIVVTMATGAIVIATWSAIRNIRQRRS